MRAALLTLRFRGAGNSVLWATIAAAFATVASLVTGAALYLGSVGPASIDRQIAARCTATTGVIVNANMPAAELDRLAARDAAVASAAGDRLHRPRRMIGIEAEARPVGGGYREPLTIAAKASALDHVRIVAGRPRADGAALPRTAAKRLGVGPGDNLPVRVGGEDIVVPVDAIYEDLRLPLDDYWCYQRRLLVPPDLSLTTPPAFVLMAEPRVLELIRDHNPPAVATWEAAPRRPTASLADARAGADAVDAFRDRAPRQPAFAVELGHHPVEVVSDLPFIVKRATAVRDDVRRVVLPLAVATVVTAVSMVAFVGVLWADRRQREVALLDALGSSRTAIVARAVAEVLPAAGVGAAVGVLIAVPVVAVTGPRSVDIGEAGAALGFVVAAAVGALACFAAGVALRGHGGHAGHLGSGRVRRRVAVAGAELAAVAVALAAVPALDNRSSVDSIDPTAILAAVAFVVAATVAVVVPVVLALRIAGRAARWTAPSAVLAARRLYTDPIPTAAAVAVAAVCVGLFSYGTVLQSSARRTIEAKAGVFAGGQVSVVVPEMHEVPHDLTGRATSVRLIAQATTVVGAVDVLAVDPRTFSNGAFWDDDFSHRSLPDLMHGIARRGPGGAVPVLAVGRVPSRFTVDDLDLDVAVVERPHAFPGLRSRPLLVVDQRNVHAEGGERLLWANASLDTVARALRGSGLVARRPITVDRVFDAPAFYTLDWSFGFLRGTAAWAALIGAIAFLVHLDLRRRRSMAAEVVLVTMGMARSRQAASRVAEVGLALVTGCGLGIALALVAASRSHRTVDLTPYVPPASILDVPAARLALVAAGVTAALPVFAALVYASRPGKPAEVLRSELV